MSKILTVEELIISKYNVENFNEVALYGNNLKEIMIEFAKLHVKATLEAVDNNAEVEIIDYNELDNTPIYSVNSESILTAYPLENIK